MRSRLLQRCNCGCSRLAVQSRTQISRGAIALRLINEKHIFLSQELFLERFGYQPRADAAGTDLDCSYSAVSDSLNLLKIRIPDCAGFIVGMTDVIAKAGTFTADYTYS